MALPSAGQIRAARGLLGWSRAELARRARVARNSVARVERGTLVSTRTLSAIAKAMEAHGIVFLHDSLGNREGLWLQTPVRPRREPKKHTG